VAPDGHWLWLCAQFRFGEIWRTRYFRVPPGADSLPLDCRPDAPLQVWIRGVDDSLEGSAAQTSLTARSGAGETTTVPLDSRGLGMLEGHLRGVISLAFPGPAITEVGSGTSVVVDLASPHDAHVLTLVEPPSTHAVPMELIVAGDAAALRTARVAFRRVDGAGELIPLLGRLAPGHFSSVLQMPSGTYIVESVPPGALLATVEDGLLRVPHESGAAAVRIDGQPASVALGLGGLVSTDFPVRVRLVESGAPEGVHSSLEYIGPYHWNRPIEHVHVLASEQVVVVSGRQGFWLSAQPVRLSGSRVHAELQPAVEIDFFWAEGPPRESKVGLLCADRVAYLDRRWVCREDLSAPAWVGRIVIQSGDRVLECMDGEGAVLWSEQFDRPPGRHRIMLRGVPPARIL
jgi:hypothetical protein